MTGLKLDSVSMGKASERSEPDIKLTWLHRRIEELGEALVGQQNAAKELSGKGEEIIRFASETSGTIFYDLVLESGRFRMVFGMREKLGFDPEEVDLNHAWWCDQIHPEDRQSVEAQFARAIETGTGCRLRYRIRRKDGSYVPVEDVMMISKGPSGLPKTMFGCITVDRRQAAEEEPANPRTGVEAASTGDEERNRYVRRLESANRELQDLTFVASNNLLDPLRKIRVFGEMAASKWVGSGEVPEYLSRMQKAALMMQDVLDGLRLYSQLDGRHIPFSKVNLGRAAREALAELGDRVRETGAEVEIGSLPTVEGDDRQIRLLFRNLIDNGLKFHAARRRPHIQIHADSDAEGGGLKGDSWKVLVKDNGIGFEKRQLDKIFSPFQRLHGKDEYDGIGLGLTICKKIVDRHGGSITAASAVGKGSTFVVTFPRRER